MNSARRILACASVMILLSTTVSAGPLRVENGKFMKDGATFAGVGINYFDAFTRFASDGRDTSWKDGLQTLHGYGIPFIRINTFGFWVVDLQKNYLKDKPEFYRRLDLFMDEASEQNIGVILNLFFHFGTLPELNHEDYSAWGDANSESRKMMRAMTAEIVKRYAGHPALWGWEFNNETNMFMDLPAAVMNYRWLPPRFDRVPRTAKDTYGTATILPAMTEFADTIRSIDSATPIFSGNNMPRFDSYHLSHLKSWDADTPEQFGIILSRDNAGKVDTLTLHVYPESEGAYFGKDASGKDGSGTFSDILSAAMARSAIDGRPFFLGEFGTNDATLGNAGAKRKFGELADAILMNRVPLSAAWVFDLKQQNGTYNVTATNDRSYQLQVIQNMNEEMKAWK